MRCRGIALSQRRDTCRVRAPCICLPIAYRLILPMRIWSSILDTIVSRNVVFCLLCCLLCRVTRRGSMTHLASGICHHFDGTGWRETASTRRERHDINAPARKPRRTRIQNLIIIHNNMRNTNITQTLTRTRRTTNTLRITSLTQPQRTINLTTPTTSNNRTTSQIHRSQKITINNPTLKHDIPTALHATLTRNRIRTTRISRIHLQHTQTEQRRNLNQRSLDLRIIP